METFIKKVMPKVESNVAMAFKEIDFKATKNAEILAAHEENLDNWIFQESKKPEKKREDFVGAYRKLLQAKQKEF